MPSELRVTVLIENTVYASALRAEHGLAVLLETEGNRVLLDTGQTGQIMENARFLREDLSSVSHIAISHGHYDHTGGLDPVLSKARSAALHAHPAAFDNKYARSDAGLRHIGCRLPLKEIHGRCSSVALSEGPQTLPGGLGLTGAIPRVHEWETPGGAFFVEDGERKVADSVPDDQSLFWDGPQGPVVIAGCAHAGVVNTLEYVLQLTGADHIHAVLGGLHLHSASPERMDRTIDAFRRFDVQRIGVGHCTGFHAIRRFFDAFGDRCFLFSVGTRAAFGP